MHTVALPLPAEWAGSVVIDLPSSKLDIHTSVMPDVLRVMAKGAKVSITQRDKDADTKAWIDRLVFAGFVDVKEVSRAMECTVLLVVFAFNFIHASHERQTAPGKPRRASQSGRLAPLSRCRSRRRRQRHLLPHQPRRCGPFRRTTTTMGVCPTSHFLASSPRL